MVLIFNSISYIFVLCSRYEKVFDSSIFSLNERL